MIGVDVRAAGMFPDAKTKSISNTCVDNSVHCRYACNVVFENSMVSIGRRTTQLTNCIGVNTINKDAGYGRGAHAPHFCSLRVGGPREDLYTPTHNLILEGKTK